MKISGPSLSSIDRTSSLYIALKGFHSRLALKDPTTWGEAATDEAKIRLNWVDLPTSSRTLLPQLDALAAKFRNLNHLVLCGMGGSSLAPEVIAKSYKKKIFILDSTDPDYIAHALSEPLESTLVLVSSKSGSTIETSSQKAFFEREFSAVGLLPTDHMVFVTDPGSPLDIAVRAAGYSVINADPHVGGRFSALTAFGLVPAALMGVDASILLDEAAEAKEFFLSQPEDLLDATYVLLTQSQQFIGFTDAGSNVPGLSDWIEQLIAESTGKNEVGRLPIAAESVELAGIGGALTVSYVAGASLVVEASLGEHFIFWEWATALMGAALEIDPFNQPNVTEAKEQTSSLLAQWNNVLPPIHGDAEDGAVEIFGDGKSVKSALKNLIANTDAGGYIAIMAYLDRQDDVAIAQLRALLSRASGRPVSFGWGPRFLHSTGQFHKGGQPNGSFLQITGVTEKNYLIPGREFDFRTLLMAQALGDGAALASRKYPLLRLHLQNRSAGIAQLIEAVKNL